MDWWLILDRISIMAGIITLLGLMITASLVVSRGYRYRRRVKRALAAGDGIREALLVSLKPGENIRGQVEKYLKENKLPMSIVEIDEDGVSPQSLSSLRRKFISMKRDMVERGVDEIHLFYAGPVAAAFFLADVLNNWVPVYVYHLANDGKYQCWGTLTESLERLATEEMVKEVAT